MGIENGTSTTTLLMPKQSARGEKREEGGVCAVVVFSIFLFIKKKTLSYMCCIKYNELRLNQSWVACM